jgi:hypothetical protein
MANAGLPVEPLTSLDLTSAITVAHGVLLLGGTFSDTTGFQPVVTNPITDQIYPGESTEAVYPVAQWLPVLPAGINRFQDIHGLEHQKLLLTPGQFQATSSTNVTLGTQRLYSSLHVQVLSTPLSATDYTRPTIGGIQAAPVAGGGVQFQVQTSDDSGTVQRVVLLYMPVGGTSWSELDLAWDPVSGLATGVAPQFTGPLLFFVQAVDPSGNVAVALNNGRPFQTTPVDTTAPFITLLTQGTVGTNGWYTSPVTVGWQVQDAESPISSTTGCGQTVVNAPTNGRQLVCMATSAGGTAIYTATIKETTSSPTASAAVSSGTLGSNGWYTSTVTVHTTGSDPLAGPVTCTPDQSVTTDTTGTVVLGSCTDDAGLTTPASLTVKIDQTPPVVTCGAPDGQWHATDVGITCTAGDVTAGLATAADASFVLSATVAVGTETASAVTGSRTVCDAAGNCTTAGPVGPNMVDKKPPTIAISAPVSGTTYLLNQAASASYTCTDGGSGLAASGGCAGPVASGSPISTGVPGPHSFVVTARDNAGNTSSLTATYQVAAPAPLITITTPPSGAAYLLNQAVTASYTCADSAVGLAASGGCAGPVASGGPISTGVPGPYTFTVTALNTAGITSTETVTYQVLYGAAGTTCDGATGHAILQPTNADGSSVFKQGSTVAAKFRVCDANGVSIGTPGVVQSFRLIKTSANPNAVIDEAVNSTTPDTAFRWDATNQQWIFNMSTKGLTSGTMYYYEIVLNDGTKIDFNFTVK